MDPLFEMQKQGKIRYLACSNWREDRIAQANAYAKERLGAAVDRLGTEALEAAIASDDLLERKEAILAAPIREA